jgi:hypothetical protein
MLSFFGAGFSRKAPPSAGHACRKSSFLPEDLPPFERERG